MGLDAVALDVTFNPLVVCAPAPGSFFPVGPNVVTCTSTDYAGNTGSCAFTVTVTDTQPPTIACPPPITALTDPGRCDAVVSFAVVTADNCPGSTFACVASGATLGPVSSSSRFNKGVTVVTCTPTDAGGLNGAPCSFSVTVTDGEPPSITCPSPITRDADLANAMWPWHSVSLPRTIVPAFPSPAPPRERPPAGRLRLAIQCGSIRGDVPGGGPHRLTQSCLCVPRDRRRAHPADLRHLPGGCHCECSSDLSPATLGTPTVADNCPPAPTLTYSDAAPVKSPPPPRTDGRSSSVTPWACRMAPGNSSMASRTCWHTGSSAHQRSGGRQRGRNRQHVVRQHAHLEAHRTQLSRGALPGRVRTTSISFWRLITAWIWRRDVLVFEPGSRATTIPSLPRSSRGGQRRLAAMGRALRGDLVVGQPSKKIASPERRAC